MAQPLRQSLTVSDDRSRLERKRLKPADVIVRAAVAELLRQRSMHAPEDPAAVVERVYGGCPATNLYLRAAVSPAMTTLVGWAFELVSSSNADFLADMERVSAFAALAARALSVTLAPGRGAVRVPGRVHPWQPVGGWVGESQPKMVGMIGLTATGVTPRRLACLSVFTEEMGLRSIPDIEIVVREALRHDLGALLDQKLLSADAASAVAPPGLLAGVAPLTASTTVPASEAMVEDLQALTGAVMAGAPTARVVFLANPQQALRMTAAGHDVIASGFLAAGSVAAVDGGAVAMLSGAPTFQASGNATLHMETQPEPLSATDTPANTVAAPIESMFQIDATALRSVLVASWALRRSGAVALVTGATW